MTCLIMTLPCNLLVELMKMLKNIIIILSLLLYGVADCPAAESSRRLLDGDGLVVGEITDNEITDDLRHSTCTLYLTDNKNPDSYNYIEGAICPVGEEECTESAIIKLNGKITLLKKVSSGENNSVYKNGNTSILIKQNPLTSLSDDEGYDVKATVVIKTKNSEKMFEMTGYCGT